MTRHTMIQRVMVAVLIAGALLGGGRVSAQAQPEMQTFEYHLQGANFSPCTGKLITYEGDIIVRVASTTDGAGRSRTHTHVTYSLDAVEQDTGTLYRVQEAFTNIYHYNGAPFGETYINNLHFIAQGPGNNFFYVERSHFSTNAAGELTASMEVFESQCR